MMATSIEPFRGISVDGLYMRFVIVLISPLLFVPQMLFLVLYLLPYCACSCLKEYSGIAEIWRGKL